MFSSVPATVPSRDELTPCDHPVPLSVLQLDVPEPPEGWVLHLGKQDVAIIPDDLGRNAVSRCDARRVLDAHRADELRRARLHTVAEAEAVEKDREYRALLPKGLQLDLPEGASYGTLVRQAELAAQPRRRSLLEESLSGDSMTFHSYQPTPEGE